MRSVDLLYGEYVVPILSLPHVLFDSPTKVSP